MFDVLLFNFVVHVVVVSCNFVVTIYLFILLHTFVVADVFKKYKQITKKKTEKKQKKHEIFYI